MPETDKTQTKKVFENPAESLAGSLKQYAEKYIPLDEIRKQIQKDIGREIEAECEHKG